MIVSEVRYLVLSAAFQPLDSVPLLLPLGGELGSC